MDKKEIDERLNALSERVLSKALTPDEETNYTESLDAGVQSGIDYAIFQNSGYKGLYGGMTAKDIKAHKQLGKNDDILDYMGHEELAANLFRATQTEAKLRREQVKGKENASQTHYAVGKEVRDTIKRLGGTMPEDLPTPDKSIKQLEREQKLLQKKK